MNDERKILVTGGLPDHKLKELSAALRGVAHLVRAPSDYGPDHFFAATGRLSEIKRLTIDRRKKWALLIEPDGALVYLDHKPKRIAGGYMTKHGRRYVRSIGRVELHCVTKWGR